MPKRCNSKNSDNHYFSSESVSHPHQDQLEKPMVESEGNVLKRPRGRPKRPAEVATASTGGRPKRSDVVQTKAEISKAHLQFCIAALSTLSTPFASQEQDSLSKPKKSTEPSIPEPSTSKEPESNSPVHHVHKAFPSDNLQIEPNVLKRPRGRPKRTAVVPTEVEISKDLAVEPVPIPCAFQEHVNPSKTKKGFVCP